MKITIEDHLTDSATGIILKIGSYIGGAISVMSALTLTNIGIIVGIATALLTYGTNLVYKARENARAEREDIRKEMEHQLRVESLLDDRRKVTYPVEHERRHGDV